MSNKSKTIDMKTTNQVADTTNIACDITDITEDLVWSLVPMRTQDSHKGTYGNVLAIMGSSRYRGAAALAAEGALRGGCGITAVASVEPVFASIQPRMPEAILIACQQAEDGGISRSNLPMLKAELKKGYKALLMGPGMGNTPDTCRLVKSLVKDVEATVVLDADALNSLSREVDEIDSSLLGDEFQMLETTNSSLSGNRRIKLPKPAEGHMVIITPHPGEMARLCGMSISDVKAKREELALSYAKENNCIVVLKEHRTLIASPDGRLYRNTSGNSGLARGGSGDILAGMMASLAAQGLSPLDAAICAVWLHGAAAQRCSEELSETAMLPHDIFPYLGRMLKEHGR